MILWNKIAKLIKAAKLPQSNSVSMSKKIMEI